MYNNNLFVVVEQMFIRNIRITSITRSNIEVYRNNNLCVEPKKLAKCSVVQAKTEKYKSL